MSSQFNLSVEDIKNTLGNTDIIKMTFVFKSDRLITRQRKISRSKI